MVWWGVSVASGFKNSTEALIERAEYYTCPVFRTLPEKWALAISGYPELPCWVRIEVGKAPWALEPGKPQPTTWGEAESEGMEWDMPEPHAVKTGLSLAAVASKACGF